MPLNYKEYPADWFTRIRPSILKRDGNCCKFCGIHNYQIRYNGGILPHRFDNHKEAKEFLGGHFVPKISYETFMARFESDELNINRWLYLKRFGSMSYCPKCDCNNTKMYETARGYFFCRECKYHVFPKGGTYLEKSKLPLSKMLYALLLVKTEPRLSGKDLQRLIGVTYKTAWRLVQDLNGHEGWGIEDEFEIPSPKDRTSVWFKNLEIDPSRCRITVLQIAHIDDPDPMNCNESNLAALCQKCHNSYDRAMRNVSAAKTRSTKVLV